MVRVFAVAALLATALLASTANAKAPNYFVAAEAPDYNNDAVAGLLTNVNSVRKPGTAYAVFDWDNSAMFGDVSATTMFYQVDNLNFRFSPDEFKSIFALGYDASSSDKCFPEGTNSVIGKDVNGAGVKFSAVLADAAKDYKVLYDAYIAPTYKLGGIPATASTSLADIKKTTEFLNFRAKLGFLLYSLQLMNGGDDHSECSLINAMVVYPRLFVGMTETEIKAFARESLRWNLAQSLESLTYTSTGTVAVKASYSKGLRVFGGQETTIRALCKAGVAVYVISGSPEILVAEAANLAGLGYLVPRTNVYGGRFTTDSKGLFTGELLANYPTTWGPGKATIVKNILMKKHKGAAPIYSTGDSDGDCEALNTVRDGIVHINNRLKENTTCIYGFYEKACHYFGTTEPATRNTYLLQGQDRAIGMWVNSGFTTKDGVDFKSGVSTNNGCAAYKFLNL